MKQHCLILKQGVPTLVDVSSGSCAIPERIILRSGFSGRSTDADSPLSPTLQLNCDLSVLAPDCLTTIALAEEERQIRYRIRSYEFRVEARAAVISDDVSLLSGFLDTWGGVIDTVAFLFSENQQSGFAAVIGVEVEDGKDSGCIVRARLHSPVDTEACTWCGKCGAACVEKCLDPELHIDFTTCTFCGECARACPENAVDVYAISETVFECPAVILVGNPPVSVAGDSCGENIFSAESGMEAFFRRVGRFEVEERISLTRSMCQYISRLDAGCTRCLARCGNGALGTGTEGIEIDHLKCADCASCVAACPAGALQYEPFGDAAFISWFRKAALPRGVTMVMGSESALMRLWWYSGRRHFDNAVFLEHPATGSLTMMHVLFLFSTGVSRLVLLDSGGNADDSPAGLEILGAERILETLFGVKGFVCRHTPEELPEQSLYETGAHPLDTYYEDFTFSSRREKLVSVLKFFMEHARPMRAEFTGPAFSAFGILECDTSLCTACLACLNACITGALTSDQENFRLVNEPSKCIQCGACTAMCPEHALGLRPGLVLDDSFFETVVLFETAPMICRDCGAVFGTRESFRHVISVLESRGMLDASSEVLEYCETCRARRMFER